MNNRINNLHQNPSPIKSVATVIGLLGLFFVTNTLAKKTVYSDLSEEVKKVPSFQYSSIKGEVSYGSRIYKNNCQTCHGPIGVSYLSRVEAPRILGLTGQQIVDRLIYYRDAESYSILLTGRALLMSRQTLFLNDEQINSIARYFEELNPISDLNLEKQRAHEEQERLKKKTQNLLRDAEGVIFTEEGIKADN
jgi:cytochrome c553